jgi:tRNA nucleotidyltransferase (CCA-adding enzyme)
MPPVRETITPTELEQRIFKTLKAAAAELGKPVTLRCAGGWVRDKLLGLDTDSPDIDVALDTLTGAAFGEALQRHLQESHDEVARSVVIESNPEQSKHLETARIRVRVLLCTVVTTEVSYL